MSSQTRGRRPYVMAVLLGTALTTMGADRATAAQPAPKAVQDIGRYCAKCWRNARLPVDTWGDCTQEVYRRLLETIPPGQWSLTLAAEGDERREFLRAIDAVKKRTQRARRFSGEVDFVSDPGEDSRRSTSEDRELVRQAATEVLSQRQQRILQLSFEGWTVPEIGAELALPVERVSDEKYKAVRKLRKHLSGQMG